MAATAQPLQPTFGHALYAMGFTRTLCLDHFEVVPAGCVDTPQQPCGRVAIWHQPTPFNPNATLASDRYGYPASPPGWCKGSRGGEAISWDGIEEWVRQPSNPARLVGNESWTCDPNCTGDLRYTINSSGATAYEVLRNVRQTSPGPGPSREPTAAPTATSIPSICLSGRCSPQCPANCSPPPSPTSTPPLPPPPAKHRPTVHIDVPPELRECLADLLEQPGPTIQWGPVRKGCVQRAWNLVVGLGDRVYNPTTASTGATGLDVK